MRQVQLPVPVGGGVHDAHPAAQAAGGQLAEQQRVQRVVGDDGNAERQHVVEHAVVAHVGGRQHEVPDVLVIAQAGAVPDHQHHVRAEHGEVVGERLGVGRPDADVHDAHARVAGQHVMPGRHLAAVRVGPDAVGQGGAELLDVPGVVGEQHVPLEHAPRWCRCSAAAGRWTGPSAPGRTGTASCAAGPTGSRRRRARAAGRAGQRPPGPRRRRSGRRPPPAAPAPVPGTSGSRRARRTRPRAGGCAPTTAARRPPAGSGPPPRPSPWPRTAGRSRTPGLPRESPRSPPPASPGHQDP